MLYTFKYELMSSWVSRKDKKKKKIFKQYNDFTPAYISVADCKAIVIFLWQKHEKVSKVVNIYQVSSYYIKDSM